MDTVNALTFRKKFGEIIDKVVRTGQPIIIERQNEPVVVMYPFDEKKEEVEEKEVKERMERASKMLDAFREKYSKHFKGVDTTALIRKARDERYGKKWLKTRTHYWNDK